MGHRRRKKKNKMGGARKSQVMQAGPPAVQTDQHRHRKNEDQLPALQIQMREVKILEGGGLLYLPIPKSELSHDLVKRDLAKLAKLQSAKRVSKAIRSRYKASLDSMILIPLEGRNEQEFAHVMIQPIVADDTGVKFIIFLWQNDARKALYCVAGSDDAFTREHLFAVDCIPDIMTFICNSFVLHQSDRAWSPENLKSLKISVSEALLELHLSEGTILKKFAALRAFGKADIEIYKALVRDVIFDGQKNNEEIDELISAATIFKLNFTLVFNSDLKCSNEIKLDKLLSELFPGVTLSQDKYKMIVDAALICVLLALEQGWLAKGAMTEKKVVEKLLNLCETQFPEYADNAVNFVEEVACALMMRFPMLEKLAQSLLDELHRYEPSIDGPHSEPLGELSGDFDEAASGLRAPLADVKEILEALTKEYKFIAGLSLRNVCAADVLDDFHMLLAQLKNNFPEEALLGAINTYYQIDHGFITLVGKTAADANQVIFASVDEFERFMLQRFASLIKNRKLAVEIAKEKRKQKNKKAKQAQQKEIRKFTEEENKITDAMARTILAELKRIRCASKVELVALNNAFKRKGLRKFFQYVNVEDINFKRLSEKFVDLCAPFSDQKECIKALWAVHRKALNDRFSQLQSRVVKARSKNQGREVSSYNYPVAHAPSDDRSKELIENILLEVEKILASQVIDEKLFKGLRKLCRQIDVDTFKVAALNEALKVYRLEGVLVGARSGKKIFYAISSWLEKEIRRRQLLVSEVRRRVAYECAYTINSIALGIRYSHFINHSPDDFNKNVLEIFEAIRQQLIKYEINVAELNAHLLPELKMIAEEGVLLKQLQLVLMQMHAEQNAAIHRAVSQMQAKAEAMAGVEIAANIQAQAITELQDKIADAVRQVFSLLLVEDHGEVISKLNELKQLVLRKVNDVNREDIFQELYTEISRFVWINNFAQLILPKIIDILYQIAPAETIERHSVRKYFNDIVIVSSEDEVKEVMTQSKSLEPCFLAWLKQQLIDGVSDPVGAIKMKALLSSGLLANSERLRDACIESLGDEKEGVLELVNRIDFEVDTVWRDSQRSPTLCAAGI